MNRELNYQKIIVKEDESCEEYYYKVSNNTSDDLWLDNVILYECQSLQELGLPKDSKMFRSGRHKNDMPGIFTFGVMDGAMKDVMGAMAETGDKIDVKSSVIVSDHLTILGKDDNYVVISFITGQSQMFNTRVYVSDNGDFQRLESDVEFNVRLKAGEERITERIRIEKVKSAKDAIDRFASDKAKLYGSRNSQHPSVFCTWYYYGLTVTYDDVMTNLRIMEEKKLPFDVFQVDEGWEIVLGEWEPNAKFPVPMKQVAEQIKAAGYRPGIWTSPFVAHETATVWKQHPEWILRDKNGEPCLFPMNDTVYYIFDITNSATWDYFYELYRKLTYEWGYTYHKLDFTRAAVIIPDAKYYDDTITLTESYVQAVKAIRRGMGEESYFLMCGGLYDPIIGIVDAQRTGSDVLSMWSSNINKDGKTAPYTIKQSILRYYMNSWWNNDPDALMVRKNEVMERNLRLTYGLLNDDEVKTSVINQFIGGGIICSTEPLDKIDDERLYELRRIMPVVPVNPVPLNIMDSGRFPENVMINISDRKLLIARTNWSDDEDMDIYVTITDEIVKQFKNLEQQTDESGQLIEDNGVFVVCDYYSGAVELNVRPCSTVKLCTLKPHASTVIKIEKQGNVPIIVGSTGHYSMGEELESLCMQDGDLRISGKNPFDYPIKYEILIPGHLDENCGCYKGCRIVSADIAGLEKFDRLIQG